MKSFVSSCFLAVFVAAAPKDDLMGTLPMAEPFSSPTYSGYLDASETKKLHYVYAESLNDPENDPV